MAALGDIEYAEFVAEAKALVEAYNILASMNAIVQADNNIEAVRRVVRDVCGQIETRKDRALAIVSAYRSQEDRP